MSDLHCIAFADDRRIAEGELHHVAREAKRAADKAPGQTILIFDAENSEPVDIDFRGSVEDVLQRLVQPGVFSSEACPQKRTRSGGQEIPQNPASADPGGPSRDSTRGPGRPRLGVVAREVTLLPRHWEWLSLQPGGASVALRKLVEDARKAHGTKDRVRKACESTYRFASAMAGNRPNYEDAMRALFASDGERFDALTKNWPPDIRDHARRLSAPAFATERTQTARSDS
jgi:hypothetical protein